MSYFYQLTYNAVDSFLTLAAALAVVKFFQTVQRRKEYDPIWEVLQRHIRLTVPIAVVFLIRFGISEHLHVGPIYTSLNEFNRRNCPNSVFSIMLGFENFHTLTTSVGFIYFLIFFY